MNVRIGLWQICGFAAASLGGTLLHYLYDWLGKAAWIAPFSGVNESTWEHMKLLFWPMLIFAVLQRLFFVDIESFWCIKLRGTLLGLILIPILFYTYNGVVGKSPDWLNIAIFFISAAIAYIYEARLFNSDKAPYRSSGTALLVFCLLAAAFVVFSFRAPRLGIFRDPLTGGFGLFSNARR